MAHAFKRKDRDGWYLEITAGGKIKRFKTAETTHRKTLKLGRAIDARIAGGQTMGEAIAAQTAPKEARADALLTFRAAVPLYMDDCTLKVGQSRTGRRQLLNRLAGDPWANTPLRDLKPVTINDRLDYMVKVEKKAGGTANAVAAAIGALIKWAVQKGHIEHNPLRGALRRFKVGSHDLLHTAEDKFAALDACPTTQAAALVGFLYLTGMRRMEAATLHASNIDHANRTATIRPENEKAGRGRVVTLTDGAYAIVKAQRVAAGVVFRTPAGCGWSRHSLDRLIERLRVALPECFPHRHGLHLCRHYFISNAVAAGVTIAVVGQIVGQSSAEITRKYAHRIPERHREAMDLIAKAL